MGWIFKDFKETIKSLDTEIARVEAHLEKLDPASDEYEKVSKNLQTMLNAKATEVSSKNETWKSLVPAWATGLFGSVISIGVFRAVLHEERDGGLISTQAVNVFDKVIRSKF